MYEITITHNNIIIKQNKCEDDIDEMLEDMHNILIEKGFEMTSFESFAFHLLFFGRQEKNFTYKGKEGVLIITVIKK